MRSSKDRAKFQECRSNNFLHARQRLEKLAPALIKRFYFEKITDCVDPISSEFEVHNGYLAEKKSQTSFGRSFDQLKIITSRGKQIVVRRYDDEGGELPFLRFLTLFKAGFVIYKPAFLLCRVRNNFRWILVEAKGRRTLRTRYVALSALSTVHCKKYRLGICFTNRAKTGFGQSGNSTSNFIVI